MSRAAVELSGAGALSLADKSATGVSAFTHKTTPGEIVATGIWKATALLSFKFYGIAPGALMRESQKFKRCRFSLSALGMLTDHMPAGGWRYPHPLAAGYGQTERGPAQGQMRQG
jgi:hypothetical protein